MPQMVSESIYAQHTQAYAMHTENGVVNAGYDRPTILELCGDLRGKRVLELGCAAGALTDQLALRAADVVAVDREPRLVSVARKRLGGRARVEVADLEQPLRVATTASKDLIVASLVLHYVEHWTPLLAEVGRILVPGGTFVFSIHHPITGWLLSDMSDYHRIEIVSETWDLGGHAVQAQMYRRPLSSVFGELRKAGFVIDAVAEPRVTDPVGDADRQVVAVLRTQPVFLFIRAVRS
ncbi:class I SAM-dependent methyltransferase [Mycobacterium sp. 050128]|uniref:class I SAM-dependent methyltransferase n=1 Tax=Mycobacterium sp. 050128 TaxID=3096112 RepID=UPI002EDA33A6